MPELPEVETIRRQLGPLVAGRPIVAAGGHPSGKFNQAPEAAGATLTAVRRRGKYLLLPLDDGRELVVHLGMTGVIALHRADHRPGPYRRAWWALGRGQGDGDLAHEHVLELADVRRFGRVAVVPAGSYSALPTLHHLGPEPFDPDFTADRLYAELRRSGVRVKSQLLGQRVVAGVGNIYADEALWAAGINPGARQVSRPKAAALHGAILDALTAGIANGGTRLRDYRTMDGDTGTNQHHLRCYGRAAQPCLRCGALLRRRVVDTRGTTWCPSCQAR